MSLAFLRKASPSISGITLWAPQRGICGHSGCGCGVGGGGLFAPLSAKADDGGGSGHGAKKDITVPEGSRDVDGIILEHAITSLQHTQPPRGSGIQPLLDYNKQWAAEISHVSPHYFSELAKQQNPQYLWIGCSDSRVPANEIVGLLPGDIFVHRNVANVVSRSDLNCLAVLQYAVDCLEVEHIVVSGHYGCGGVTAALNEQRVGLADHWILHVGDVKKRFWKRIVQHIPEVRRIDALCELNVITQLSHVVDTHIVQRHWVNLRESEAKKAVDKNQKLASKGINVKGSMANADKGVELHGWVYGLKDGIVRPLISLNRFSDIEKAIREAEDAVFMRYAL